jgi:hypothetical protein
MPIVEVKSWTVQCDLCELLTLRHSRVKERVEAIAREEGWELKNETWLCPLCVWETLKGKGEERAEPVKEKVRERKTGVGPRRTKTLSLLLCPSTGQYQTNKSLPVQYRSSSWVQS